MLSSSSVNEGMDGLTGWSETVSLISLPEVSFTYNV